MASWMACWNISRRHGHWRPRALPLNTCEAAAGLSNASPGEVARSVPRRAKGLQGGDRLFEVSHRYLARDTGVTDGMGDHETDASVYEFLVVRERVEDFRSREIRRQSGRKMMPLESGADFVDFAPR